ncbi:MAG TPA: hypothetical protein VLV78_14500 [Thermoanaerobaculia bacterium]|nr:hypothetical protein [Thermoanaerobaculia bacterium]
MAKVQGKKRAAAASRRATAKIAARVKSAARAIKKKVAARKPAAPARSAKKPAKPAKPAPKPAGKVTKAAKRAAAAPPAKPVAVAPSHAKAPVARHVPPVPRPAEPPKKTRTRRPRPRVHSNGTPVAAWLPQGVDKPRPSSFIPAPARAAAPSLSAAPPASSDRLIRPEDVTEFVTRTVPIRVDIEQGGGRVFISVNPEEVTLRAAEGIEWDFRYLGGTDVMVDELVVEFEKPSPFSSTSFRSRKPGAARPHRQMSGPAHKSAGGKRVQYTIRAINAFKTELANRKLFLNVQL